ncbi:MAG TPA: DMT family transporter [Gemmatimonadaceae bacterium]|nr:DMT family transporter [Gemmatimonadaceae bacterium]
MTESIGSPLAISETASQPKFGVTDVLLFMMATIWGINFVVVKYATHLFNPLAFTGLRVLTVAVFLVVFALSRGHPMRDTDTRVRTRGWQLPLRRDLYRLLLFGVIGNGLYQLFFVIGVAHTRAGNAALIVGAAPAFIALASRARGLERVKRMTFAGIGLSVIGVAIVIFGSARPSNGEVTLLGSVLVFFGVLCWTAYTILLQPYTRRIDVINLSAITMIGGAVPLLVATTPAIAATNWSAVGVGGWLALLYSSVISMGVAYMFYYRGLRILGPTRTAVYTNLQPIIALLVAWAFLGENPTAFQGVGAVTIIAGVFLTRA